MCINRIYLYHRAYARSMNPRAVNSSLNNETNATIIARRFLIVSARKIGNEEKFTPSMFLSRWWNRVKSLAIYKNVKEVHGTYITTYYHRVFFSLATTLVRSRSYIGKNLFAEVQVQNCSFLFFFWRFLKSFW